MICTAWANFMKILHFRSMFEHKVIQTLIYGTVHSFCFIKDVKLFDGPLLDFKTSIGDSEVFIYPKGYEFWFNMPDMPIYLSPIKIDSNNDDGIARAGIYLNELVTIHRNKEGSPCTVYSKDEVEGNICYLLNSCNTCGEIQTLDLRFVSQVFYHCTTGSQLR